jgi:hypothetical protein
MIDSDIALFDVHGNQFSGPTAEMHVYQFL